MKYNNIKSAFTLIELLVVIAIIGIGSYTLSSTVSNNSKIKIKSKKEAYSLYSFISRKSQEAFSEGKKLDITIKYNEIKSENEDGSFDENLTLNTNFIYIINGTILDNSDNSEEFSIKKNKIFNKDVEIIVSKNNENLQQIKLYKITGFIERNHIDFNKNWISE